MATPLRHLTIHVTQDPHLVEAAQRLRYRVFFADEHKAAPSEDKLDSDMFDGLCQHLVVIDENQSEENRPCVVGTYRLRLFEPGQDSQSLYTESEFDLSALLEHNHRLLELGRSCVHEDYRDGEVIKLLWQAIGHYITQHRVAYLFGCVSFPEADIATHLPALSYLHHYHRLPDHLCPKPQAHCAADYTVLPKADLGDEKQLFSSLPPLVKGYIRIGGQFGQGAVLDKDCNTLDVCLLVDPERITPRYMAKFVR